jgi:hypothetical protein
MLRINTQPASELTRSLYAVLAAVITLFASQSARAATNATWAGTGSPWGPLGGTSTQWGAGPAAVPGSGTGTTTNGDTANFTGSGSAAVAVPAYLNITKIVFTGSTAYTLSGALSNLVLTNNGSIQTANADAATQTITAKTITLEGAAQFSSGSTTAGDVLSFGGTTITSAVSGGILTLAEAGGGVATSTNTISNSITQGSGLQLKLTGGTWLLNGTANTYANGTAISAGTLVIGNATALGASTSAVTITGGALDLGGTTMTGTNSLSIRGTGISSGGALTNSSATAGTYAGLVTLTGATSIGGMGSITLSNAGTITGAFGMTLQGAGGTITSAIGTGAGGLTNSSGTWTLTGANT